MQLSHSLEKAAGLCLCVYKCMRMRVCLCVCVCVCVCACMHTCADPVGVAVLMVEQLNTCGAPAPAQPSAAHGKRKNCAHSSTQCFGNNGLVVL